MQTVRKYYHRWFNLLAPLEIPFTLQDAIMDAIEGNTGIRCTLAALDGKRGITTIEFSTKVPKTDVFVPEDLCSCAFGKNHRTEEPNLN
jgi:hypothetical protein